MFKRDLIKPDGRRLILYSQNEIDSDIVSTCPNSSPVVSNPHLRWHPLRGEWVSFASHRQDRTFRPSTEFNPFSRSKSFDQQTELPKGEYSIGVFENLFPMFSLNATDTPQLYIESLPAAGVCEVVVYTNHPTGSLAQSSLEQINLLLEVLADRTKEISKNPDIRYIMPFENRGVEMGVTLEHPHMQIYGLSIVPPLAKREFEQAQTYFLENKKSLFQDIVNNEISDGRRILINTPESIAFVPAFARYPYEVWIIPHEPIDSMDKLSSSQRFSFAKALKTITMKYDALWNKKMPYVAVFKQGLCRKESRQDWRFHIQLYPALRTPDRLKYLAGSELGAGLYANDCIPEQKAEDLRKIEVKID